MSVMKTATFIVISVNFTANKQEQCPNTYKSHDESVVTIEGLRSKVV